MSARSADDPSAGLVPVQIGGGRFDSRSGPGDGTSSDGFEAFPHALATESGQTMYWVVEGLWNHTSAGKEREQPPASSDSDEASPSVALSLRFRVRLFRSGQRLQLAMLEPNQLLEFAPTAFVGTVTEVPAVVGRGGGTVAGTFEVETVLAGEVPSVVDVTTADNSAACGFRGGDRNPDGSVRSRRGRRGPEFGAVARRPMPIWRSRRSGPEPLPPKA